MNNILAQNTLEDEIKMALANYATAPHKCNGDDAHAQRCKEAYVTGWLESAGYNVPDIEIAIVIIEALQAYEKSDLAFHGAPAYKLAYVSGATELSESDIAKLLGIELQS